MSTRFHIGAHALRGNIAAYAKRFDLLEVRIDRDVPTLAALKRWRKSVPPHFEFAVVAGSRLALLRPSDGLEEDRTVALAAVQALQARVLVIQTPAEVTPGAVWRDRMTRLLDRLPRDVTQIVWEPRGVWEIEDAAVAARKWGIVLGVDASRDPVPAGAVAYVRLRALGETRSFGEAALERVVRAIGARRDAYVVLETTSALAECKRIRQLAQRRGSGEGGMGRVVRPRPSPMKIGDDEQE